MEKTDNREILNNGIPEDEDLMLKEVIQDDADLYYLHNYLTEIFRNGDIFKG